MINMETKKVIKCKEIIGFVIFLFIICFLFSRATWLFRGNDAEAREDILGVDNEKCDIDVILFDGSDVLRFYDPLDAWNKYGYTSYNYATSSAQADMLRFYAQESRETHDAKVYVFDLRTITFVTNEISESTLRNWSDSVPVFSWVRTKGIYSYIFNRDKTEIDIPSYFLDIIKYHTKYDSLASEYQWSYMDKRNIYNIDKGFDPYKNHTPFIEPIATEERGNLSDKQINALKDLVDYCDKEKLNALFICSPIVIKEEDQKLMNSVSDYIEERGYEFIDFNKYYDEIGIDFGTDYGDVNHVNYFGAKKFTDYFATLLVGKYDLPDHRNDEEYSSWDDDYKKMEVKRNEWLSAVQNDLNSHLDATKMWEQLQGIDDFTEWYGYTKNRNYTVIIKMSKIPKDLSVNSPISQLISDYGIDSSRDAYIGVWKGTDALFSSSDDLTTEMEIGVDGGRGTDSCKISVETDAINIAGEDYCANGSSIQIVVYDNNYKKVIDNVCVQINSDDSVLLSRLQ